MYFEKQTRYYSLKIQQDLFSDWLLIREYGRIGNKGGQTKIKPYQTKSEALQELEKEALKRVKRDYLRVA